MIAKQAKEDKKRDTGTGYLTKEKKAKAHPSPAKNQQKLTKKYTLVQGS